MAERELKISRHRSEGSRSYELWEITNRVMLIMLPLSAVVADNQSFEVNFKMCHVVNFVRPSAIPTSDIAHLCLSPDVCIM